jgi:hypothetical protein
LAAAAVEDDLCVGKLEKVYQRLGAAAIGHVDFVCKVSCQDRLRGRGRCLCCGFSSTPFHI